MNRTFIACCASSAITLIVAYLIFCPAHAKADIPTPPASLHGFETKEIRFDESLGNRKPNPQIPATWKLVAVSNGDAIGGQSGAGALSVIVQLHYIQLICDGDYCSRSRWRRGARRPSVGSA